MPPKNFIAVSSVIYQNKLVMLNTSCGRSIYNEHGIDFQSAIDFLFSLRSLNHNKGGNVFVCYAFSRDNEFLFSQLPSDIKDKLFQAFVIQKQVADIETEQESLDNDFYRVDNESQEYQEIDFSRYVNKLALKELITVKYAGYDITLANGKRLVIRKGGKQFTLYDVYGFFNKSLREAVNVWLNKDVPLLDKDSDISIKDQSNLEIYYIKALAIKLNNELLKSGINLSKFYGCGAVSSWVLTQTKAKTEYHNYRYKRQLPNELYKAVAQGYYSGRVEQLKIGSFNRNVNIYDINSAYAFAIAMLPQIKRKPTPHREWQPAPFSVWFCEYDFTSLNSYIGLLPNRDKRTGRIRYGLRGSGYFWQPEISYLLKHYPQCINIKQGFVFDCQRANFTNGIIELYELRKRLQLESNPLEKVIKLGLACIYGKFCQRQGKGHFVNLFYAGFITSVTRMQLLDAVRGQEHKTICFLTDAIHTTANLKVPISNELGEYKKTEARKAFYLDAGIYRYETYDGEVKEASRGFREFDFDLNLKEIASKRTYTALVEFFVGHNLYSFLPIEYRKYLEICSENKSTNPTDTLARFFEQKDIDLTQNFLDSRPISFYNGLESGLYQSNYYKETDLAKDSLMAGRI
jgi:hypothetical protein